jgi:2'-hydroxyisoflavone reductase
VELLLLGGTRFLGRHLAEAALAAGHRVTLLHRGRTGADLFPEATHVLADRDGGLDALDGRRFDAVADLCGYVPRVVGESARRLRAAAGRYAFVSSVSAYATPFTAGADESHPLAVLADPATEAVTGESYGGLKAACERAARDGFGEDRTLVVRPGLIVGPHDPTDRFPYWPRRIARGGRVLAPAVPDLPVQVIDARDLATWLLASLERGLTGTFNAVGPAERLMFGECLRRIASAVGASPEWVWVDEPFLLERGVEPWMGLPLWVTGEDVSVSAADGRRARAEGLRHRPLEAIARDTLAWDLARPEAARAGSTALAPAREAELLAEWDAR